MKGDFFLQTLERDRPDRLEPHTVGARALPHLLAYEHLARPGVFDDASCDVHRSAEVVAAAKDHTPGIDAGPAPVRAYIDELLPDVLEGRIEPGRVFDRTGSIEDVPNGYRTMNDREVLKVQITF